MPGVKRIGASTKSAVATYQEILKKDSRNQQAADGQVIATMRWVENFGVLTHEGQNWTDVAAPKLDAILPILDAGLARAKGQRSADILAHIGWGHWLNWHIAEREIGPAAEQSFRRASNLSFKDQASGNDSRYGARILDSCLFTRKVRKRILGVPPPFCDLLESLS
jgi:hypothetical protein